MRHAKRVQVVNHELCNECAFKELLIFANSTFYVDCRNADCDQHIGHPRIDNGRNAQIFPLDPSEPEPPSSPE